MPSVLYIRCLGVGVLVERFDVRLGVSRELRDFLRPALAACDQNVSCEGGEGGDQERV